jgi:hypothetical protein
MGLWSYALLSCVVLAFKQSFKPESMSSTVRACSPLDSRQFLLQLTVSCEVGNTQLLNRIAVTSAACVCRRSCSILPASCLQLLPCAFTLPYHCPVVLLHLCCVPQLYSACFAWALHWLVARLLLKGMNVPGVAWSELLAYTGYPFVLICFTTLGGFLAGVCGSLPGTSQLHRGPWSWCSAFQ